MRRGLRRFGGFTLALLAFSCSATGAGKLSIDNAWIRTPPPGMRMLAGYALLHNAGDASVAVTAAASADFGSASLHESSARDGVERMRPVDRVEIAAGASVTLAPGGMHLMLMQPRRELKAGDRVAVRLRTAEGMDVEADFVVRDDAP